MRPNTVRTHVTYPYNVSSYTISILTNPYPIASSIELVRTIDISWAEKTLGRKFGLSWLTPTSLTLHPHHPIFINLQQEDTLTF